MCLRGRTNQVLKTKGNESKNELFIHLNMNAAFDTNALTAIKGFLNVAVRDTGPQETCTVCVCFSATYGVMAPSKYKRV